MALDTIRNHRYAYHEIFLRLEEEKIALLAAFQRPMRPDSTIEKRLGPAQQDLKPLQQYASRPDSV
jgi:hypothetical protein